MHLRYVGVLWVRFMCASTYVTKVVFHLQIYDATLEEIKLKVGPPLI